MTRYSPDHKARTRAKVVDVAAAQICVGGLDSLGIASVMAEAGLTHGGFYAHFASRDALAAAAVTHLFELAAEAVDRFGVRFGDDALERYVDFYLSARHRDDTRQGCPVPVLSGEVRNAAPDVKAAFEEGLALLADRLGALDRAGGRKGALRLLGEMAGVLALSRTMADMKRSNDLLAAARKQAQAGSGNAA